MKKIAILVAAVAVMASCCNCKRTKSQSASLTGITWELAQLGSNAVSVEGKYQVNFSEDGKVSGLGFCNRLTGAYTNGEKAGQITFAPIASTMMMCIGENVENDFFKSFEGVTSYTIDGSKLYLFSNGELKAVFVSK